MQANHWHMKPCNTAMTVDVHLTMDVNVMGADVAASHTLVVYKDIET